MIHKQSELTGMVIEGILEHLNDMRYCINSSKQQCLRQLLMVVYYAETLICSEGTWAHAMAWDNEAFY